MLFQELGKLKRSSIMTSIIIMAVGILMIICPPQYIDTLVSALGYGMVTLAAVMVMDFLSSRKVLMNYIYLTGALLLALLGIAVLTLDEIVRVLRLPRSTVNYRLKKAKAMLKEQLEDWYYEDE